MKPREERKFQLDKKESQVYGKQDREFTVKIILAVHVSLSDDELLSVFIRMQFFNAFPFPL